MGDLPHSLEAERAVLSAMLASPDALLNVVRLKLEDFYDDDHKLIFDAIKNTYNKSGKADAVTVIEHMILSNTLNQLSNKEETIYDLVINVVSASNVEEYIRIVQDKTTLRKLVMMANEIANKWQKEEIKDIGDYVSQVESDVLKITRERNVGGFKTSKEVIAVLKEKLFANGKATGNLTGVTSGFTDIDNYTHGFQNGDLVILAARPSMGKTALALNFLVNAAIKQNVTTAMFSVEMPAEALMQRMISSQSGVNNDKIRSLNLSDKDWTKIDVAASKLSKAKIFVDDTPSIKLGDLAVKARKLKNAQPDLSLIIVDYLQIVKASDQASKEGTQKEVTEISQGLKALARELDIPIIALSQLSRDNEKRDNKRPMLSDLRGSGAIEQDADLVMFIYREDYFDNQKGAKNKKEEENKNNDSSGIAEVSISKHRNGATGVVKLVFLKEFGLFSNYSKVEE